MSRAFEFEDGSKGKSPSSARVWEERRGENPRQLKPSEDRLSHASWKQYRGVHGYIQANDCVAGGGCALGCKRQRASRAARCSRRHAAPAAPRRH